MLVVRQGGSRACLGANKIVVFSFLYFTRREYLKYLEPMQGLSVCTCTTKNMYVNTGSLTLRP